MSLTLQNVYSCRSIYCFPWAKHVCPDSIEIVHLTLGRWDSVSDVDFPNHKGSVNFAVYK